MQKTSGRGTTPLSRKTQTMSSSCTPFTAVAWSALQEEARVILSALWETRLGAGHRCRFQSDLTQDEQQLIMRCVAPHCAVPLSDEARQRLRHVSGSNPLLSVVDKCKLTPSKATLRWAQAVDLLDRADGTLPTSIKVHVDASAACRGKAKQLESFAALDRSKVAIPPLDPRERALLSELVQDVSARGASRTVLVLIFIAVGKVHWPHQEYEPHITKLIILPDGTARYEDHAMSMAERQEGVERRAWLRGGGKRDVYIEPRPGVKRPRAPPDWCTASNPDLVELDVGNRWSIRVHDLLCLELRSLGVELRHEQRTSLQSYGAAQCALAMLFDLHLGIPDAERQRVCDTFRSHPDRVAQKVGKSVDDRSGNHTMLLLYEAWILESHRSAFDAAREWKDANSLKIGDLLSSGVCDVCDLFDSPANLLLCAVDGCACAMHTFCMSCECRDEDWKCQEHTATLSTEVLH